MAYERRGTQVAPLSGTYVSRRKITPGDAFRLNARGVSFACGVDEVDNLGWFHTTNLQTSTDNVTLTVQPRPANVQGTNCVRVLRFGASVYLASVEDTSGFVQVFKSQPPSAGTVAWTSVLTTAANQGIGTMLEKSTWASGTNYLFCSEYGDPVGGPSLWRSPDGTTWTKVLGPIAGLRHFHHVAPDPYTPGVVYLTAGDGNGKVVAKSTDSGATWAWIVTNDLFQAVQISFTTDFVFFAGDQGKSTFWVMDRTEMVPRIASTNFHFHEPVPGGAGARGPFSDGVAANASTSFTSASAAFSSADVGKRIRFAASGGPYTEDNGVFISSVTNATTVVLNKAAGGASTGLSFFVDGETFYRSAFYGAVDPATGIYYCIANDNTSFGNRSGLFYCPQPGARLELLECYTQQTPGMVFFRGGNLWSHQAINPLLAVS